MARGIDLVLGVSEIFLLGAVIYDRFAPFPDIPDAFRERTFAFRPKPTR